MKRLLASTTCGAVLLATVALSSGFTTAGAAEDTITPGQERQLALGIQIAPKSTRASGLNPYLSIPADRSAVNYSGWRTRLAASADLAEVQRDKALAASPSATAAVVVPPVLIDELEPDTVLGGNDVLDTAEPVPGFGTGRRANPAARILGTLAPKPPGTVNQVEVVEDNGAIPPATASGVKDLADTMITTTEIGDGPHGSAGGATGDFDFYQVTLSAGDFLVVDTSAVTIPPEATLDTVVVVYDRTGVPLAGDDDGGSTPFASRLEFDVPADGPYYVMVSGFGPSILPEDPNDPASGQGVGAEGVYDLNISIGAGDVDIYAVDLRAGDVLGSTVSGAAARLQVFDPAGVEVIGSTQDLSFIYPSTSPLPGGGNAVLAHVANDAGTHYLAVSRGVGDYDASLEVYRAGLETAGRRAVQTVFLDFDGARLNTNIFGGPGVRTLTGLRGFLGAWGLAGDDEDALIDAIIANFEENLRADLIERGNNPRVDVRILNSRDHADPFGRDNVSRIIIGGTIAESGIPTIGIAQSIDPGNFGQEDTALVLLDVLSLPPGEEASLNTYLTPQTTDRIAAVAQGVGNVTAHEAGHYLGNFHTDQFNEIPNLQDQGGNFTNLFGTGPDLVLGTTDDVDVDFGEDVYVPNEGLTGLEDTLNNVSFGLTPGGRQRG